MSEPEALLGRVNQDAPEQGQVRFVEEIPFGEKLSIQRYELRNGLQVLLARDGTAPVIAFHAWFRVGSRHESRGKTGLAHLFEHLMFNEVEGIPAGEFDKRMEAAGADNNASTWLDFTQYQEAFPKQHLPLVVDLEARRMDRLVLRDPQVSSEKDVVKNERRYRVEDDVDGSVEELLWKTAFEKHSYHWPTIGWMEDIEGFTTEDCQAFYRAFYAPNNASLILVGDLDVEVSLKLISQAYGSIEASTLPQETSEPEPAQKSERTVETTQPTPTEKVVLGYKAPPLDHPDHIHLSVLIEILVGGRASRMHRRLVREEKAATEISGYVGPHKAPSLIEFSATSRGDAPAERLLTLIDEEVNRVRTESVSPDELSRACARLEYALLSGLDTADGKASTIGFYECVLGKPSAALARLQLMQSSTREDLRRVAETYLTSTQRTVVIVRRDGEEDE